MQIANGRLAKQTTFNLVLLTSSSRHVELPFTWKIVKPCCRPAGSLEEKEAAPRNRTLDVDTAFAVEPQVGTFLPEQELEFTLSFSPMDVSIGPAEASSVRL